MLRRLNIGRRVFVSRGLRLEVLLGRINRAQALSDGRLFRGEKGGEGQRGLDSWRLSYWRRLHYYIISDAGVCPCSSRTFILYVVTAKGVLQSYY